MSSGIWPEDRNLRVSDQDDTRSDGHLATWDGYRKTMGPTIGVPTPKSWPPLPITVGPLVVAGGQVLHTVTTGPRKDKAGSQEMESTDIA